MGERSDRVGADERVVEDVNLTKLPLWTRTRLRLLADASDPEPAHQIPVEIIAGRALRPCLALVGGVHGDEYDGILACQETARPIEPDDLDGTLVVVPVANPFAFAAARRRTPQDDVDLNRVFPGDASGTLSQRLAHVLTTKLLRQIDLVFSLHGAMASGRLVTWIEFFDAPGPTGQASFDAASASGFPNVVAIPPDLPGRLLTALGSLGVPVVEGEVGGRGEASLDRVRYYRERIEAVARRLGVLPSASRSSARVEEPRVWAIADAPVLAGARGIFVRAVELGQTVVRGERLGQVVDARGEVAAVVRAPVAGMVGGCREHAGVDADTPVATILVPARPRAQTAR